VLVRASALEGCGQVRGVLYLLQVIFLDADQVIRTDIRQLADLDLQVSGGCCPKHLPDRMLGVPKLT
jgi:hypothetical protein